MKHLRSSRLPLNTIIHGIAPLFPAIFVHKHIQFQTILSSSYFMRRFRFLFQRSPYTAWTWYGHEIPTFPYPGRVEVASLNWQIFSVIFDDSFYLPFFLEVICLVPFFMICFLMVIRPIHNFFVSLSCFDDEYLSSIRCISHVSWSSIIFRKPSFRSGYSIVSLWSSEHGCSTSIRFTRATSFWIS